MADPGKALVIGVGAEKGLGASVSARFAREGLHVFVAGRTAQSLDLVVKQIRSAGGTATAIVADTTRESDVVSLYDQVCAAKGSLDVAVYNAGNNTPGAVMEMQADYFEQAWRVCCFGGFLFGREAALRNMAQAMAKELGPKGLHVGHVVIDGGIDGDRLRTRRPELVKQMGEERLIDLSGLADAYWFLHQQQPRSWTFELDMRSKIETW